MDVPDNQGNAEAADYRRKEDSPPFTHGVLDTVGNEEEFYLLSILAKATPLRMRRLWRFDVGDFQH